MTNPEFVRTWVETHPFQPIDVDCATTVMLKILDGKCKMRDKEKRIMEWLYDAVKTSPGELLDTSLHDLIATARADSDDAMKMLVYEKRLLAETTISRPVMKRFKAMIRQQGLFQDDTDDEADD
ncbi:hypothetical protein [Methylomonas sp. MgM2]